MQICGQYKKWLAQVQKNVLEADPSVTNIGKASIAAIANNAKAETKKKAEEELLKVVGEGSNKVYREATGRQSYDGQITDLKFNKQGMLDVKIKSGGKTYAFNNVDVSTGMSDKGSRIAMLKNIDNRMFDKEMKVSAFTAGTQMAIASAVANKYVSHMMINGADDVKGFIKPHVLKWHASAKANSGIYRETVNLVSSGFGNPGLLEEMKVFMNITGDVDRKELARATTIADRVQRRNTEILMEALPRLDKELDRKISSKKVKEDLDVIFGTSGFGYLYEIEGVIKAIEDGKPLSEVKDIVKKATNMDDVVDMSEAKKLKEYLVDRDVKGNMQNADGNVGIAAMAALLALEDDGRYKSLQYMINNETELYTKLRNLSGSVKTLDDVVNRTRSGTSYGEGDGKWYTGYDGHGMIDVFDDTLEFKQVDVGDGYVNKYLGENSPWSVLKEPKGGNPGIIYRVSHTNYMEGLGVNNNRISNGVPLEAAYVKKKIEENSKFLDDNNIVYDEDNGYPRYRMILSKEEFKKAGGKSNIAHRLYRTYVHNKGLIETQSVRQLISERMTHRGEDGMLKALEDTIKSNKMVEAEDRNELKPFIASDISEEDLKKRFPKVAEKYKRVENVSSYGDFSEDVKYVRRDMEFMLVGYKQESLISDNFPRVQQWESTYKQLVQMLKLKLVVANPAKLGTDILSNFGILMTVDVPIEDVWKYSKDAVKLSDEMAKLEADLVVKKLKLSIAETKKEGTEKAKKEVDKVQEAIEGHEYYDAIKYGFVQSMATNMLIKEYDTISGLQNTINRLVEKVVKDDKGDSTEVHNAIVWWMEAGFGVNDVLDAVGNMSAIKGTRFSDELIEMGQRLNDKKARLKAKEEELGRELTKEERAEAIEKADTIGYVSEFLAAPSSEIIRQGSRVMQLGDAMARWALYKSRLDKMKRDGVEITDEVRESVAVEAVDMFIDYRLNMPADIKRLSDYGVLMFPSFWLRAQKVIWNLAKYHPVNAGGGFLAADALGIGGASILDANVVNKLVEGHLIHAGQNVLDPKTFIIGL